MEALKAYSEGWRAEFKIGDISKAVTFYKRAVELDPNFAVCVPGLDFVALPAV